MKVIKDEEESLQCSMCGKRIKHIYSLERHMRVVHEGNRPYNCNCGKSFATREQHTRHTNSKHTMLKPYLCEMGCSKAFASYSARAYHHNIIHKMLRQTCPWFGCNKTYSSQVHLSKHLQKPHSLLLKAINLLKNLD